jgi:hypothetical protein
MLRRLTLALRLGGGGADFWIIGVVSVANYRKGLESQRFFSQRKSGEIGCPSALKYGFPKQLLVKRVENQDARFGAGARSSRIDANHSIFLGAESANTGLVHA